MSYREPVEHLSIRLEDIKLATKNFDEKNFISGGGFGRVYKGELVHSGRRVMVAVKRLDRTGGQGEAQFWNEISILSDYKHENIIKLLGFSDEGDEKLLVYEYLPMQSLNMHLSSGKLSWVDRLNVCIGVARGLKHLHTHTPSVTKQFVLHSDIKSYNILLDTKWNAKISDFGLSRVVPVVVEHNATSFHFNTAEGTKGYCDPAYINSGCLTKENDVYSFGVLLFEMLCGRPGIVTGHPLLSELAQRSYEEKEVRKIVLKSIREQISPCSLDAFSAIAYQCLQEDHNKRPSIDDIVKQLRIALASQMGYSTWKEGKMNFQALSPLLKNNHYYNSKLARFSRKVGTLMEGGINMIILDGPVESGDF